ncbi:MAG: mechanosensitive ion channel family protein [Defluviitaleaceae bacterium]|nr:mechanosensitive ion channel family protein [Defluviitaleaceae bacterium]MCL2263029.1 mechanosensitive ion channel family protein [Defluviitaleaceae bacterium]
MIENFLHDFFRSDEMVWELLRFAVKLVLTFFVTNIFRVFWRRTFTVGTIHLKFIKNVLSAIIWIAGVGFSLSSFSQFQDIAMAFFAGSGIAALTIGLAAQQSLSNAFNGLFISIFKPFEVGDRVHLVNANITGFIEDLTLRHTVIRTFMNSRIIIPNSIINNELIENSNFCNPLASAFIDIIITYDSDVPKACEIMAEVIGSHPDFVDTRTEELKQTAEKVPVFVRNLSLHGPEIRASMWTETISNNFAACSDVRRKVLHEFQAAGITISEVNLLSMS